MRALSETSAMAQVVGAERGNLGGWAGAHDRGAELVGPFLIEHAPVRVAIVARAPSSTR